MRRLLYLIGQLFAAAIVIVLFTVCWIVLDGLTDLGDRAQVALVFGDSSSPKDGTKARLDRVLQLHSDGDFPAIIVSSAEAKGSNGDSQSMAKYLVAHGLPASMITQAEYGENMPDTAENIAELLRDREYHTVLLVTDYYYVTRTKLELYHEDIKDMQKAHIGALHAGDTWKIGTEVVALYDFIGKTYLLPAADKVKTEAQAGIDKAKADAHAAKEQVDKGLNSLPQ